MLKFPGGRKAAGVMLFVAGLLCSMSYGFTCSGGTNIKTGCPMGGIGGGNFNFNPNGTYDQTWIRVTSAAGAAPLCIAFQKRGATVFSANLQHAGNVTTTYTAYWPTVTEQYTAAAMLDIVQLKCFSPIIAGDGINNDNKNSSLPIAIYKFTITNRGTAADTAAIALSNTANATVIRNGTAVIGIKSGTVCVMVDTAKSDPADIITCGAANTDFATTGLLNNGGAGFLAKRIVVGPGLSRTITFCVSWTNVGNGYYRNYFTDAQLLATYGIDNAVALEAKVDNWHNKILNSNMPAWLKDLVINCLHVYNCMTDWVTPNTYGMAESMSSGMYGTNDQAYHAHFALPCFAPDAAWSQVARMASVEGGNGLFAHTYGGDGSIRADVGQKFIMETYKDYQWTGNTAQLQARYNNIKNAIAGCRGEDNNADGLTDDNTFTTYDNPQSNGWVNAHKEFDNELYLGALKAAIKSAVASGNAADNTNYSNYFAQAQTTFENTAANNGNGFWNTTVTSSSGKTGYYQAYRGNAMNATAVWNAQFMGQWCADVCGLGPLHPESRIQSGLDIVSDACLDPRNPPVYDLMMCAAGTNNANGAANGAHVDCGSGSVNYGTYGCGELCAGFGHNRADVSMRALHAYWNVNYSKTVRPFNAACKLNLNGDGVDWGTDRYMNPPACFAALFGITGFTIDVNAKELRIKPNLPTSAQYKMDSLIAGPLLNPISCGTVDYKRNATSIPPVQRYVIKFDNPMQFNTFYAKKLYAQLVSVVKPAVGGNPVVATIAENASDTSEYKITFGSPLTIDNNGALIVIGADQVGTRNGGPEKIKPVEFAVNMKPGAISYVLPQRTKVSLALVDVRGVSVMRYEAEESAGTHVVRPEWKNLAAGTYYAHFKAGDVVSMKKLVYMR